MADFTNLNAAIAKLGTDVDALVAASSAASAVVQPAIDSAATAVEAADAKVVAATPTA